MSTTIMSNGSNNMKWEQVGSKRKSNGRPTAIPKLQPKEKSKDAKTLPKIETLPPLKVEKSIYDLLDREDESDEENKKKVVKPSKPAINPVAKKSPKPQKQSQSIRLTASSSVAQPQKKLDTDLESVMFSVSLLYIY